MNSAQITLRNVKHSTALARRIQEKCEALEKFHPHIIHCRVVVEHPAEHVPSSARPFCVTLRVAIPGRELVVGHARDVDAHVAVREAFETMKRQLKEAASGSRFPDSRERSAQSA
ncbi:MAG TPA: HPF/RaiA family ribosome-associated protein [Usitatibacter sp.]|nr:HPF/RaiA family ribosome-associated protein [Usitatibacter sp.]